MRMNKIKDKCRIEVLLDRKDFAELEAFRLDKGWTMAELLRRAIKAIRERK